MAPAVSDFFRFLRALWPEWIVLLTGGTIFAALSIWGLVGKNAISKPLSWGVVAATFVMACFRAWRTADRARAERAERVFIDSPKAVVEALAKHTSVVAEHLSNDYVGQWIKVGPAEVHNVRRLGSGRIQVFLTSGEIEYSAFFSRRWKDRLMYLELHEVVSILGQIESISDNIITLANCEFQPVGAVTP
jgi:hypothetical protein